MPRDNTPAHSVSESFQNSLQALTPLLPPAWGKSKRRIAVMYSGWPPLSKERRNQPFFFLFFFCFSIPIKEEQKGGTAFPCSPSLIIAFWEQAHINFCHPKHHLVLLCHGLVLIHQQTPAVPPGLREDRACVAVFQSKRPLSLGLWHQLSHFTGRRKQGPPLRCNMSQHLAAGPSPSFHDFRRKHELKKIKRWEPVVILYWRNYKRGGVLGFLHRSPAAAVQPLCH